MKKILIADDEPNIIMSLEYTFRKQQYQVFIARDGREALEIAKQEIPDLLILDIMMPNLDGYSVIEKVRQTENLSDCKILILSAKNKQTDIEKGLSLGADAYMTKPFSVKKLVEKAAEMSGL
ncbi:response regulator [Flavobacterium sp.]|uniref:response regulator transcription factor n=1 Tax=Flavobacterium sp. TaxID=239 RepID=UPI0012040C5E|nr:response regulator [Flavobacterium sp.]RZJ72751.1 MAG: response regulator [Flavobacterium sp.]